MTDRASFQLRGVEDLKRTLTELGQVSATKVGTTATREAGKIIKAALVASAPRGIESTVRTRTTKKGIKRVADYGRLHENIVVRKLKPTKAHQIRFGVGVGKAFWGMFQEFGTRHHPARPWMRPAFDQATGVVIGNMALALRVGIDREARRLARVARKLGIR